MRTEKWIWRATAAVIYAAVFFVTLSVMQEKWGGPDEPDA